MSVSNEKTPLDKSNRMRKVMQLRKKKKNVNPLTYFTSFSLEKDCKMSTNFVGEMSLIDWAPFAPPCPNVAMCLCS